MASKLSSYQKLKAENERLKKEISILIDSPNSIEAAALKMNRKFHKEMLDMMAFGERSEEEELALKNSGIFSQMAQYANEVTNTSKTDQI